MKIYTRTGDAGKTALFGGERVLKNDARVEAYGTVDEANAALGMARAAFNAEQGGALQGEDAALDGNLAALQSLLFDLGADLATPASARQRKFIRAIDEHDVESVEEMIDGYTQELPELRQFILPGGATSSAAMQLARAVLRRAERVCVPLMEAGEVSPAAFSLLNRLSDLFFTLARVLNARVGAAEVPWVARRPGGRASSGEDAG